MQQNVLESTKEVKIWHTLHQKCNQFSLRHRVILCNFVIAENILKYNGFCFYFLWYLQFLCLPSSYSLRKYTYVIYNNYHPDIHRIWLWRGSLIICVAGLVKKHQETKNEYIVLYCSFLEDLDRMHYFKRFLHMPWPKFK